MEDNQEEHYELELEPGVVSKIEELKGFGLVLKIYQREGRQKMSISANADSAHHFLYVLNMNSNNDPNTYAILRLEEGELVLEGSDDKKYLVHFIRDVDTGRIIAIEK